MKTVTVREAKEQLPKLIEEACAGEVIVLRDGDRAVTLAPEEMFDLEADSPELEAELLKAAKGPFTPFDPGDLRQACEEIARRKRVP